MDMKILIIDNYDSFTYNLYQYIGEIFSEKQIKFSLTVKRNDEISAKEIVSEKYDYIVISPGPGSPEDKSYFGVCADVLVQIGKNIPVLGVCLGMQGMAHYFGGKVIPAKSPIHGKTSLIKHSELGIFENVPDGIEVMRYHSLVADKKSLPECLEITAESLDTREIMGLRHKKYPIEGVQFHPESIFTEGGKQILSNFFQIL